LLREHLEAPADHLLKSRKIAEGPAWEWPLLTGPFDGTDLDHEGYITFGISITFDLAAAGRGLNETLIITPTFKFKPIPGGVEVFTLERRSDGVLVDTDRFEISDDNSDWDPLLERCVTRWREMMSFDPYHPSDRSRRIGFDTVRPARGPDSRGP
jgi:hypothetical protein